MIDFFISGTKIIFFSIIYYDFFNVN